MTAAQSLNLYNISLRYFKNEADASAFVKEIEEVVDNKFAIKADVLSTKQDIAEAKADILKWMVGLFIPLYLTIIGLIVTIIVKL